MAFRLGKTRFADDIADTKIILCPTWGKNAFLITSVKFTNAIHFEQRCCYLLILLSMFNTRITDISVQLVHLQYGKNNFAEN